MQARYAVVAFPDLDAAREIEAVRRRYDPLAGLLAAHVTLVFPCAASTHEPTLAGHLERSLAGVAAFTITLVDVSVEPDGYVFLDVGIGAAGLVLLHRRLYSGPLAPHRSLTHEYRPHVTVGRLPDVARAAAAGEHVRRTVALPQSGTVRSISLFRLESATRGDVALSVPLGGE